MGSRLCLSLLTISILLACSGDIALSRGSFVCNGVSTDNLSLEIAAREDTRAKGLMFRRELAPERGMLFVFPIEEQLSFWMKNTVISLDMIFINSELEVIGLLERVPPLNEEQRRVEGRSQYVVELAAGRAKELGIAKGCKLSLAGEIPRGE